MARVKVNREKVRGRIEEESLSLPQRRLEISKQRAPPKRVLVVNDNKNVVEMVMGLLASKGHKVEGVQRWEEGLKR